ncbi:lipopolysaccharide biosynthesis protein [Marinobacter sp. CP1]|jgi:polysaccharide chain length determinant protein (PEP-CTERM system associated)|uniref:XrtA system polysaccharide chain length determinant n=1 Tax=unclassified Marinobacter TaxID=83889 RepID=UPI00069D6526|nr:MULTISPECIES: XrtA system polysaccharide chain length determinant [unclassified Marinobacter]AKV94702.1 lipopolysaccharide biosynthesis protein [Marinobacter sp. CP1]
MALPLAQIPSEAIREVRSRKGLAFLLFFVVSFAVLGAGFIWPYKYESEVIIYVDDSNIIRPLMEGSAVTTKISERLSTVRETLWRRSVMEQAATDTAIFGNSASNLSDEELEERIASIRASMEVSPRGDSYFAISYRSGSPLETFRVAQKLGQLFIQENSERKRAESRNAYGFIDKQVKSYEQQIAEVEARLKNFLSENVDGTEAEANARMANLRGQLELAQIEKSELESRARSLQQQLETVSPTLNQGGRTPDAFERRIQSLEEQLDNLRLQYHDSYPDIVILKEQLAELRNQRDLAEASGENEERKVGGETLVNPLYQDLRGELVTTRADIETIETRIRSLNQLMARQEERMERIQANKAEYSELTRDMEVNKQIYDDLLKRREKARLSMHLDIEGQGLNYQISETAQYPRAPSGPQFPMFAAAGLLLGIVAPFGAAVGFVQIDPRVRAREQLEESIELPVLAELPRVRTPFEKRRERKVTVSIVIAALLVSVAYVAVAVSELLGVI